MQKKKKKKNEKKKRKKEDDRRKTIIGQNQPAISTTGEGNRLLNMIYRARRVCARVWKGEYLWVCVTSSAHGCVCVCVCVCKKAVNYSRRESSSSVST